MVAVAVAGRRGLTARRVREDDRVPRYSHLSPGHRLDAVLRLNVATGAARRDTRTDTDDLASEAVAAGAGEVLVLPTETSGGALDRTGDLGIVSSFEGDPEETD